MNIFTKLKFDKLYKNICPNCGKKGNIGNTSQSNTFSCSSCNKKYYATNKDLGADKDEYKELN